MVKSQKMSINKEGKKKKANSLKQKMITPTEMRSTVLSNDTQTEIIKTLKSQALREPEVKISANKAEINHERVNLNYILCPSEKKISLLYTFLKKNRQKKIIIFFSSGMSVKYHLELLQHFDLSVTGIHEQQKQSRRKAIISKYCNDTSGFFLCTEMAIKDIDIPNFDSAIQFDPPENPEKYLKLIVKSIGDEDKSGQALLFLNQVEKNFIDYLQGSHVQVHELKFNLNQIAFIQPQIEKLITQNYVLYTLAREAYKAYLRAYDSHSLKNIFNVDNLDITEVAKSFGFTVPPAFDLKIDEVSIPQKRRGGGGYGYLKQINNLGGEKKSKTTRVYRQIVKRKKKSPRLTR